jgi:hypothetical protein
MAGFLGSMAASRLQRFSSGDVNPSGKLPITMERRVQDNPAFATLPVNDPGAQEIKYSEGLFVGYRGYENRIKPQYPFGYGLSYTKLAQEKHSCHQGQSSSEEFGTLKLMITLRCQGFSALECLLL